LGINMQIEDTFIKGLKIIRLNKFTDQRGSFLKVFNKDFFKENNLVTDFQESYFSVSQKNVIRGMHFQVPPFEHTKLVYLNQGAVTDVVLDIRKNSETFGKYFSIKLTEEEPVAIYIPIGCAHGFISHSDNSMVTYLQTSVYNAASDQGIRYDSFGMDWGISNPIISDRDLGFKTIEEYDSTF